ncbi:MAG: COG4315 family predicted lipoprotein [Solirubrobacterales bacterium]
MKSKKVALAFALAAVAATLVIAGCGGGGSSSSSSAAGGGSGTEGTIGSTEIEGLGSVLVDAEGRTVYDFTVDEGTMSNCYGGCAAAWPPVTTTGKPTAGAGAMASDLGTTKRKDGTLQVTYKGHPLYTYAADEAPGEVNGQEAEGTWFVLDPKGAEVKGQATGGEAEPASSGGGY